MNKKILALIVVALVIPQIALAAWWNPFSWFNNWGFLNTHKTKTSVQIQPLENNVPSTTSKILDSKIKPTPNAPTKVLITSTKSKKQSSTDVCTNIEGLQTSVPAGMNLTGSMCNPSTIQIVINSTSTTAATPPTASTTPTVDVCANIEGVQTTIPTGMTATGSVCVVTPTNPPPPTSPQTFSFTPIIELGGATELGFVHPEFSQSGCLGCDLTDYGRVYLTINEPFDSVTVETTDTQSGYVTTYGALQDATGQVITPGHTAGGWGTASDRIYEYKITATRSGFLPSVVTGSFTSRPARLVALRNTGGAAEGYIFMDYGADPYVAQVQLKAKNNLTAGKIVYYPAPQEPSNSAHFKDVLNIQTGDIISMNDIRHSLNLKDNYGNWLNITDYFGILSATATKNGQPISFVLAPNTKP